MFTISVEQITALNAHFSKSSVDCSRNSKDKSKYSGLQKICLSIAEANKCILRTIRIFESMIDHHGPKTEETLNACGMNNSCLKMVIPKIIPSQFFRSLANNLQSRLFTMQASRVGTRDNNLFKDQYNILLSDLDMLDPKTWPDKFDFQHGDASLRRLAKQFQVDEISSVRGFREFKEIKDHSNISDLKPLLTAVNTVAISSCACERSFSAMNNILTPKRNALSSKHLCSLLFINCVGPPVKLFIPSPYIHTWISNGRRIADEVCCPKRKN
ncbi:hypothetical protein AGLY_016910 [Aphis glycines]|uniref:HAT C-terminal dimerisation domain-containing protein n=1 Tax=Aphis glycines TaxID=307491 RepID=A0A6G0SX08_APHGL|nr:hypothetical protein AGLY_016910 [Aphis glycines]